MPKGDTVSFLAFSVDGKTLLGGATDGKVLIWSAMGAKPVAYSGLKGPVTALYAEGMPHLR